MDVGPVTPKAPELDVVAVGGAPILEDRNHFVGGAVDAAQGPIGLGPNADVERGVVDLAAGGHQREQVSPVHADEVNGPVGADLDHQPARLSQEGDKLGLRHFAAGHAELAVVGLALAADIAVDGDIVRRVGEDHRRTFITHQACV